MIRAGLRSVWRLLGNPFVAYIALTLAIVALAWVLHASGAR
jgi:membrane-bound ClpP family serine protease